MSTNLTIMVPTPCTQTDPPCVRHRNYTLVTSFRTFFYSPFQLEDIKIEGYIVIYAATFCLFVIVTTYVSSDLLIQTFASY